MSWLDAVRQYDQRALDWVQRSLVGESWDLPMRVLSDLRLWLPFLLVVGIWLAWKGGPRGRRAVLAALVVVFFTDQLSATVLKPLIGRPRPTGNGFGFPSSHAANIFGQAVFFSRLYPRMTAFLLALAVAVGFSRVYLNKHYPLDVLGGAVLGAACGWFLFRKAKWDQPIPPPKDLGDQLVAWWHERRRASKSSSPPDRGGPD